MSSMSDDPSPTDADVVRCVCVWGGGGGGEGGRLCSEEKGNNFIGCAMTR